MFDEEYEVLRTPVFVCVVCEARPQPVRSKPISAKDFSPLAGLGPPSRKQINSFLDRAQGGGITCKSDPLDSASSFVHYRMDGNARYPIIGTTRSDRNFARRPFLTFSSRRVTFQHLTPIRSLPTPYSIPSTHRCFVLVLGWPKKLLVRSRVPGASFQRWQRAIMSDEWIIWQ